MTNFLLADELFIRSSHTWAMRSACRLYNVTLVPSLRSRVGVRGAGWHLSRLMFPRKQFGDGRGALPVEEDPLSNSGDGFLRLVQ
jgi:hypothetical protein